MKILFLKDDSGIKEVSFTKKKLLTGLAVFIIVFSGLTFLTVDLLTNSMYQVKLDHVRENNKRLVNLLNTLQGRIQGLEQNLSQLQSQDKAIRSYADLPDIDQDIRKLGIGGTRYDKTAEYDFLIPSDSLKVSGMLFDVDRVQRMVQLERKSYEKLYETFKHNTDRIQSTPSIRPLDGGYFTDGFGYRRDPFTRTRRFHYGLDISARRGTPVYATADGIVVYSKRNGGYGLVVKLDHGFGFETGYAHLSKMDVKPGQRVKRGEKIGEVGNTGRSTAPHLHYEVWVDGDQVNPLNFFFSGYLD